MTFVHAHPPTHLLHFIERALHHKVAVPLVDAAIAAAAAAAAHANWLCTGLLTHDRFTDPPP